MLSPTSDRHFLFSQFDQSQSVRLDSSQWAGAKDVSANQVRTQICFQLTGFVHDIKTRYEDNNHLKPVEVVLIDTLFITSAITKGNPRCGSMKINIKLNKHQYKVIEELHGNKEHQNRRLSLYLDRFEVGVSLYSDKSKKITFLTTNSYVFSANLCLS